jgi:photosynthetic reaction center cytochrome c subunit
MSNQTSNGNDQIRFLFVFLAVTGVLVLGSWWVLSFIVGVTRVDDGAQAYDSLSPIYVDYQVDVDEWVSAESYLAMGAYQNDFPMPQNVEVLTGLTTQEINGYMMNYFVAGLHVNCTYCHNINNFAAYEDDEAPLPTEPGAVPHPNWSENKYTSRTMLYMTQELNREWLGNLDEVTALKAPSGSQIICATCHYGAPQPDHIWSDQFRNRGADWVHNLPDEEDFARLLDASTDLTAENQGVLNVNGRTDISLDTVGYQQQVMYHMNYSMNVGCTHCHNARYFPSREVPAVHYSQYMLQMNQALYNNEEYMESMNGVVPNCIMCHNQAIIPPGAVISPDIMPDALVATDDDEE